MLTIPNNSDIITMKIRGKTYLKKGEIMIKDIWFGGYILEEEDKKAIAKKMFDDYKQDLIEFVEEKYAEQGENEPIDKNIDFEKFWAEIDHDLIMDFEKWAEYEEEYAKDFE